MQAGKASARARMLPCCRVSGFRMWQRMRSIQRHVLREAIAQPPWPPAWSPHAGLFPPLVTTYRNCRADREESSEGILPSRLLMRTDLRLGQKTEQGFIMQHFSQHGAKSSMGTFPLSPLPLKAPKTSPLSTLPFPSILIGRIPPLLSFRLTGR